MRAPFRFALIAASLGWLTPTFAAETTPTAAVAVTNDARATPAGHTFSVADGFALTAQGAMSLLKAPEGDTAIAIVDIEAKSADEAVAKG